MSEKLAPSISGAHFEKMMALKPANARKHTFAGQLLMEAIDREFDERIASGNARILIEAVDRLRDERKGQVDNPASSP